MRAIRAIGKAGATAIATAILMAAPKPARAGRLGTDTIALFPKNIGEFAYCDLKKARSEKWFPQLQQQMIPERFRQFEKFLASAGVDPNSQVDELAWGLVAEGLTPRARGRVRQRFRAVKKSSELRWAPTIRIRRKHISSNRSCRRSRRGVTRCSRSAQVPGRATFFSSSSIRIPRRSGIALSSKKWSAYASAKRKAF